VDDASAFELSKRHLVTACATIAAGLAVAGSIHPTAGGILLLAGWGLAVHSLHRLGRAGRS
jgi:hypothetical protein